VKKKPANKKPKSTTTQTMVAAPTSREGTPRTVERWPLDKLRPHPRNAVLFDDLPSTELTDLAQDMKRQGLITPIEIMPEGMIICGHQRVQAARQLEWTEIEVVVRHDLVDQDAAVIEERLISDNLNRREMDPLTRARCIRRIRELAYQKTGRKRYRGGEDLRDALAKQLGLSGRHLSRIERLLLAPREVQRAVSARQLPLISAEKVTYLAEETQARIAEEIAAGKAPRQVVAPYLAKSNGCHKNVWKARQAFRRTLEKSLLDLEGRFDQHAYLTAQEAPVYHRAHNLLTRLLAMPLVDPTAWKQVLNDAPEDEAAVSLEASSGSEDDPDTMSGEEC
jgi:ParB family chromosome partitioning protein